MADYLYLRGYRELIPESELQRLESLLNVGPTEEAALTEEHVRHILEGIQGSDPVFSARLLEGRTDSAAFNANLREILADLAMLYRQSDSLASSISSHFNLHTSEIQRLRKEVRRLEDRLESISILADRTSGYAAIASEDFLDESRFYSTEGGSKPIHFDRDGKTLRPAARAEKGSLVIPALERVDLLRNDDGETTATIEVLEQSARAYRDDNPLYEPASAIDGSPDTFWSEVILSPSTLRPGAPGIDRGAMTKLAINFAEPAAVSEIVVDPLARYPMELVSVEYLSGTTPGGYLLPFDPLHPRQMTESTSFRFPDQTATGLILTFRQVHAERVLYTLAEDQVFDRELWSAIAAIERGLVHKRLTERVPDSLIDGLRQGKIDETDPAWQAYLDLASKYRQTIRSSTLRSVFTALILSAWSNAPALSILVALGLHDEATRKAPYQPKRIQIERYLYSYGARSIDVYGVRRPESAVYVSAPFEVEGNVRQVALEADEHHPLIYEGQDVIKKSWFNAQGHLISTDLPLRRTSIEYYVAASTGKDADRWLPILPLGQLDVQNEFLYVTGLTEPSALTRFEVDVDKPVRVYRNEMPLPPEYWSIEPSLDGQTSQIIFDSRVFDASDFYTIDYTPLGEVNVVDLIDAGATPRRMVEYFDGARRDHSVILSHHPYVDMGRIIDGHKKNSYQYNPVQVVLNPSDHPDLNPDVHKIAGRTRAITSPIFSTRDRQGGLLGAQARLLNVTSYMDENLPVLRPYNPKESLPTFEYYHTGKRVFFSEPFRHATIENPMSHGQAIIQVSYDYLVSGIMVKIILRRSPIDPSLTPEVNRYSLRLRPLNYP